MLIIDRGVQIQSNTIKTAKLIQTKSKTDQNRKNLDWIGSYILQIAWIGSHFRLNFQNQFNSFQTT